MPEKLSFPTYALTASALFLGSSALLQMPERVLPIAESEVVRPDLCAVAVGALATSHEVANVTQLSCSADRTTMFGRFNVAYENGQAVTVTLHRQPTKLTTITSDFSQHPMLASTSETLGSDTTGVNKQLIDSVAVALQPQLLKRPESHTSRTL